MNFPFFKSSLKNNWVLLLIFTVIMLAYLVMILSMYNEDNLKALEAALEMVPGDLAAAVGMDKIPVDLTDFAANYFYGFLIQLFILVHVIILPLRLIVRYVDKGSLSYLLSTPNSRSSIALTQALYMAFSLLVMMTVVCFLAIIYTGINYPGILNIPAFLGLNLAAFLLSLAMSSITFFFSCLFNEYHKAAGASAAVLVTMFVLTLIGRIGHHKGIYGLIDKFSILQFFEARSIISGQVNMVVNDLVLIVIILVFCAAGIMVFRKKDLPL